MKADRSTAKQLHPQLQKLDNKLKSAAKMYEEQFLRQMVKAMRDSVSHSNLTKPGMAESIYREQMDDHTVESWVNRGGTGFADMIYRELVDKFYPQLGERKIKDIRPINLSDRSQKISRSLSSPKQSKHTFNIQLSPQKTQEQSYLKLPWKGKLEKTFEMPSGEKVAMFSHPFGLSSTFVFRGQVEPGLLNKTLSDGENFAQLHPDSQNMTWQIQDVDSRKGPTTE